VQQQRLGEDDPLELSEVQPLVGAVRAGVRVLDTGDQDAGLRERLEELGDERDRAADAHVDGFGAVPGRGERAAGRVVRRTGGVDLGRLAGVDDVHRELRTPGHVTLEVRPQAAEGVLGRVAGGDPHRDLGARGGDEGVAGAVDLGRVQPGHGERGPGPEPLDDGAVTDPLDAGCRAGLGAQPVLGVLHVGGRAAVQPLDRHVPAVVVEAGDQAAQRDERIRDKAAPHAGVDGVGERADLDVDADQAAEARGQGGDADVPVAGVGDDDDVGAQPALVLLEQRGERVGTDLLLALDEHRDVHGQLGAEDPQRAEVRGDAGLVVGGATGVQAAVALGRLERRRVPLGVVVLGLDVVVGVEQHRRRALGSPLVGDDGRGAPLGADDVDGLEVLVAEELGDGLGAALDLGRTRGVGADRLDADQVLEVLADAGQHRVHPCPDVVDGDLAAHGAQPIRRPRGERNRPGRG